MKTIDMITASFAGVRSEHEKAMKELNAKFENSFKGSVKALFEMHPDLVSFGWNQSSDNYDDSSYYFAIRKFNITLSKEAVDRMGLPVDKFHWDEYEGYYYDEPIKPKQWSPDRAYVNGFSGRLAEDLKAFQQEILKSFHFMKELFGEHCTVTANSSGIEVGDLDWRG
jgi:hypothetical protein